jgi:hypothetical protein
MKIIASKSGNHVVFIDASFNADGFAVGAKIGALEFNPKKFKSVGDAVKAAEKLKWTMKERVGSDFYDVVPAK